MTSLFQPVKTPRRSLPSVAADAVIESIDEGRLAPGERLPPERLLTRQLGVSRTSLREAMKMLESMGVVEARIGRGRFVAEAADEGRSRQLLGAWLRAHRGEVDDLNEIRTAVERAAVAGIPGGHMRAVASELRRNIAEAREALARGDAVRAAELDSGFHRALCAGTPNRPLATLAAGLIESAAAVAAAVYAVPRAARASLRQHAGIAAALERGDLARAQGVLDEHLRTAVAVAAGDR